MFLVFLAACQSESNIEKEAITLSEAYPGNISDVDKIQLIDGGTGERKIVDEKQIIERWINEIKDIELLQDDNQEERSGYRYGITLYEGEKLTLGLTPIHINSIYYKGNQEFGERIKSFFEEQFGRGF